MISLLRYKIIIFIIWWYFRIWRILDEGCFFNFFVLFYKIILKCCFEFLGLIDVYLRIYLFLVFFLINRFRSFYRLIYFIIIRYG